MGCSESKQFVPLLNGGSSKDGLPMGKSSEQFEEARTIFQGRRKKLEISQLSDLPEDVLDMMRKSKIPWDEFMDLSQILFNVLRFTHKLHVSWKIGTTTLKRSRSSSNGKRKEILDSVPQLAPLDESNVIGSVNDHRPKTHRPKNKSPRHSVRRRSLSDSEGIGRKPIFTRDEIESKAGEVEFSHQKLRKTESRTKSKSTKEQEMFDEDQAKDTDAELRSAGINELQKALDLQAAGRLPAAKLFKEHSILGKGGYGVVYKCTYKKGDNKGSTVAIKKMNHFTEKEVNYNFNEIGALLLYKHPNIVEYGESHMTISSTGQSQVWLVMEYMEGGTLSEAAHLKKFEDSEVAYVAMNILKPLEYLHSHGVAHRDLKSVNIMMTISAQVKLIDFGLTLHVGSEGIVQMVGSPFWMPPEMIQRIPHGTPADIWSTAVSLMELKDGKPPNKKAGRLAAMFTTGAYGISPSKKHSEEFSSFLRECLIMNPEKRATVTELQQHSFLKLAKSRTEMEPMLRDIFLNRAMRID